MKLAKSTSNLQYNFKPFRFNFTIITSDYKNVLICLRKTEIAFKSAFAGWLS